MSLSTHISDGRDVDELLRGTSEKFVMKSICQITTAMDVIQTRIVMLTTHAYYEFKIDPSLDVDALIPSHPLQALSISGLPAKCNHETLPSYPISYTSIHPSRLKKRKEWLDIHSVSSDPSHGNPASFELHFFSGSVTQKAKMGFSKMKRYVASSMGTQFHEFVKTKRFLCGSPLESAQYQIVFTRIIRDNWQKQFEACIIPEPEYYQRHVFVIKKTNNRILVISNKWIYNVEATYKPTIIQSVKWSIPIVALTALTINNRNDNPTCFIQFDQKITQQMVDEQHVWKEFSQKGHAWSFRSSSERDKIVVTLRQLYQRETGGQVLELIQGVSESTASATASTDE